MNQSPIRGGHAKTVCICGIVISQCRCPGPKTINTISPCKHGPQNVYRIEIRYDYTGTLEDAQDEAHRAAGSVGGEVTAIFDENWNEI